ncbi:Hybrid sensor histidine kinase/response regulator [Alteromonas sp. 38]|uniref:hybrid sensor histidine kinase/response regulator n=1 Tax=Alteromonas TaxID=226 RepID=UPI0012F4442C|nr:MULTISPECIES: PAS-domain containing protein [Alteromonas]CAD5281775.1 Hybrid sensor histidine kinase/response regulator [Alteromonas sp. 154]VXB85903.1 Hybrid sensor histidine kinase/response regulator [Alteromonas sp. 38]
MLSIWTVGTVVALYLLALFAIAFWGDKRLRDNQQHPILYSLGLGVHCTSWAFFGTTSQAAEYGWAVIPTYMGIILTMAFAFPVVLHISRLCQQHNISSLADLIGLKYQHSHLIAALITLLCFIGVIPYIALQLDAITKSINLITPDTQHSTQNVSLYVAGLMAIFAIVFGTRTLNLTDKHPGLLLSIAFESVVKLVALWVVGIFVCFYVFDGVLDLVTQAASSDAARSVIYADRAPWVYLSHVLLGVCSMFVLPRQFHMNFVELNGEGELRTARWLFPLYLLGMTVFLIPLALAGKVLLPQSVNSDAYVLALPLYAENMSVSIIAFIGGLSATTSMVIVATLALGIMIANNLVTPLWLKLRLRAEPNHTMQPSKILTIRRLTVLVVLSVALWYHLNVSQSAPLVKSGIIAIALLGQCFPVLMFGIYWQRSTKSAAVCALLAGFSFWVMYLLYPSIMSSYYFNSPPSDAELGIGFAYSLLANCVTFIVVSYITFKRPLHGIEHETLASPAFAIRIKDLTALTKRVLDPNVHQALVNQLSVNISDANDANSGYANHTLLQRTEKLLSAQVGTPSARILLGAITETKNETLPELVDWVEEASQSFQFNHEVLQSSVQNIEQGISVLDEKLQLLAWNERYIEMFDYPRAFLKTGMSIESILSYNAKRGLFGNATLSNEEINKRIVYMKEGSRYKYVRKQPDGKVIELNGSPLPGGGYVTTYSDITEYIAIQEALERAKFDLEGRVAARTEELQHAKLEADRANESKTKFLAAAGHDLMQPFNAATLFAAMLAQKTKGGELATLSEGVVSSLNSAESLLTMLLDMTKLESGKLAPQTSDFALDDMLAPLVQEFSVIAASKGLTLRYVPTLLVIHSDKNLLRRIVQNLLSNAIRYTAAGKVLIGVRRKYMPSGFQLNSGSNAPLVDICVYDTGAGIPSHQQSEIFNEFHQLDEKQNAQGLGLGLTIVERIGRLLHHPISLVSTVNKGSKFSVSVPCAEISASNGHLDMKSAGVAHAETAEPQSNSTSDDIKLSAATTHSMPIKPFLAGRRILLIENDAQIAQAMVVLLSDWGAVVLVAENTNESIQTCPTPPDLLLVDYHLDAGETGTQAVSQLQAIWGRKVSGVLITANRSEGIRDAASDLGLYYLPKPVKPLALKRLLKNELKRND